jgi:predicted Zn-dependent peptidase
MIKETKLDNGLLIITDTDDHAKTTTISYTVKCGSYDEDDSNRGIAHFTEHMLFKGTAERTSQEISESIEGIGGILNACTSFDHTMYHCTVPTDFWEIGVEVISDLIWNNTIPEEEFEREKQVILEELKMYDDDASSKVWELLFVHLYRNNPNRQRVGGTLETVSKIQRQQMIDFIDKYYVPNNMIVVATGNINHDKLVEFIKSYCPELEPSEDIERQELVSEKLGQKDLIETRSNIAQSQLCWGMFGPLVKEEDYVSGEIACSILGGNSSSRLYQLIREQKGWAYTVKMDIEGISDNGVISGYVGLDGNNIESVKKTVMEQLEKLKKESINEEELKRAKAYVKGTLMISLERTSVQNDFIVSSFLNDSSLNVEEFYNRIDKVTAEDIKEFANKYFNQDNICFVQIVPK